MLTSPLARCCDQGPYYIICANIFRHGYVTGQWRSEHAMLTKSVKSVISVVLKHIARAKKSVQSVRSVSDNISMVSPYSSLCQNGKQVEIITKMIFELCYIEAIIFSFIIPTRDASPPLVLAFLQAPSAVL